MKPPGSVTTAPRAIGAAKPRMASSRGSTGSTGSLPATSTIRSRASWPGSAQKHRGAALHRIRTDRSTSPSAATDSARSARVAASLAWSRRPSSNAAAIQARRAPRSLDNSSLTRSPSSSSTISGRPSSTSRERREQNASGPRRRRAACLSGRRPAECTEGIGQTREGRTWQRSPQQAVELAVEDRAGDAQEFPSLGSQLHDR